MALELDTIRQQAQRVAASHGLDVVDVEMAGGGKHRFLRVFIEKNEAERTRLAAELAGATGPSSRPETAEAAATDAPALAVPDNLEALSGVTHDDCTAFAHDFGTLLDVEDLVPGSAEYTLEVSSPGLDRKLFTAADYKRFAGSIAKVQTRQPVNNNRHFTGRLTGVTDKDFALDLTAITGPGKGAKSRKKAGGTEAARQVHIDFSNVEKASLVPEI